jgi:hypothetical protein
VLLDGDAMEGALVGVKAPINPGEHEATIQGEEGAKPVKFSVEPGRHERVRLSVSAGAKPAGATAAPAKERAPMKVPGLVALGVGAVGAGVGVAFTVMHFGQQKKGDEAFAEFGCAAGCTAARQSEVTGHDEKAARNGTIAIIGYGVGVAGLATGATLLLLSGGKAASPEDAKGVRLYFGACELGLHGRF